jgi:hypothetical protein
MPKNQVTVTVGEQDPVKELEELREQVDGLLEQCEFPLTAREVRVLYDVLAEQKAKLGERTAVMEGLALLDKLNRYINPQLFAKEPKAE